MGLRLMLIGLLAYGVHGLLNWLEAELAREQNARSVLMMQGAIAILLLSYVVLMAVPFVPGIEIGLALMIMGGTETAPMVYGATVLGLMLAYGIGYLFPARSIARLFHDLRLSRAAELLEELAPMSRRKRLARLRRGLPRRLGHKLVAYRYLSLAVLLNLPGNALIGGGGGICMLAGISRVFGPVATLVTVALAVAPVPLLVLIFGVEFFA